MNNKKVFKLGDRIQIGDGRTGIVIHVEKDPITQGAFGSQQLVVEFPDQSTQVVTGSHLMTT